ncbi:hypothetical protein DYB36_002736 [Aphanomyces astaci]|uniref:Uncharacterized protein n=1 Tax=Aphanomyces astaci TaxID=112090 RepID=A0A396ZWT0_APHAT|nr:hypothetical protein DYB36_002736 [Aphanomyces astaci]RHY80551.1 hypothetical protein DYB31_009403 [Aphanomyces astaci]
MRVRLRCAAAVTIMRHRVQAAQTSAVVATLALRQQSAGYVQEESIPLRYRLKRALAILNTSPRLHEMLQAVHTLEMCTRLSTECCVECVAHRVPRLLYKAIRKCNRSRPHLELLHQLLQVCLHLSCSRGGETAKNTSSSAVVMDGGQDVEGVGMSLELWIDLLQMHRDSTVLFTLSARLCKRTLATLNANEWSLGEAPRRLRLLHALMSKKAKTKSTVDRVAPPPTTKQAKEHLHPQKAASMLQTLVDMCE